MLTSFKAPKEWGELLGDQAIIIAIIQGLLTSVLGGKREVIEKLRRWLGSIAIILLLFILYRNKLQFSGGYKGKDRKKLPKSVSLTLTVISIIFMIIPFVLGSLLT
ncbi:hypothetical protein D8M05_14500 [Oceanobacillus bengalensis]|uniref:Uncharacterized protein n=1 Tax=Oceanobacillus bengalensis TaxID=1435466 RepID=A0A494YV54_9BACI|nr:hypothetical protein D8M05_14500 [Oceanobacillus bengalensis]